MGRTYYPRARALLSVLLDDLRDGSSSDLPTFEVTPRELSIERNTLRQADTFKVTLDYRDFPLDPRAVRAIQVALYLGDVGGPDTRIGLASRKYLRFLGYADEPSTTLAAGGETVELTGRDYTSLFLDHVLAGSTSIRVDRPLQAVVREIMQSTPGAEPMRVEFREGANVVLSKVLGKTIWTQGDNDDAWTVIVELCQLAGLLPVVELDTLVVQPAASIGEHAAAFVYGKNIQSLRYKRKFTEVRTMQVRVRTWDPLAREARTAVYPEHPIVIRKKISSEGKVSATAAPEITYVVSGPYTVADLQALAKRIYEEAAREQVEGEIETLDMSDLLDLEDLTKLGNGDTLFVELGKPGLTTIQGQSEAEAVAALVAEPIGLKRDVARALVAAWHRAENLATSFYVKKASHSWSRKDGYRLSVSFINFVGGGGRS